MSQENVEIVRRFFDVFLEGPEGLKRVAHENVVYVEDPKWPGAGTYRGREAVFECWSRYDELLGEAVSVSVVDVRDADDKVIALVRVAGRTRESALPYEHTWGYLCRTDEGRVIYFRAYLSPGEAFEAAGLRE
jgi:ketosteroid isomerase-like protein